MRKQSTTIDQIVHLEQKETTSGAALREVDELPRNQWSVSSGMSGRIRRNTHIFLAFHLSTRNQANIWICLKTIADSSFIDYHPSIDYLYQKQEIDDSWYVKKQPPVDFWKHGN
jgi:hypothetical protein